MFENKKKLYTLKSGYFVIDYHMVVQSVFCSFSHITPQS